MQTKIQQLITLLTPAKRYAQARVDADVLARADREMPASVTYGISNGLRTIGNHASENSAMVYAKNANAIGLQGSRNWVAVIRRPACSLKLSTVTQPGSLSDLLASLR